MLIHNYTRKHNKIVKLLIFSVINLKKKKAKKLRTQSVTKVIANENIKIRIDTNIKNRHSY